MAFIAYLGVVLSLMIHVARALIHSQRIAVSQHELDEVAADIG
jgi:hypothetical protein